MLTEAWLGRTLTEHKQSIMNHVCSGRCVSFDDYRFMTGKLNMIAMLEGEANAEIQKRRERDADFSDIEADKGRD